MVRGISEPNDDKVSTIHRERWCGLDKETQVVESSMPERRTGCQELENGFGLVRGDLPPASHRELISTLLEVYGA